jgi:hypothetical protein
VDATRFSLEAKNLRKIKKRRKSVNLNIPMTHWNSGSAAVRPRRRAAIFARPKTAGQNTKRSYFIRIHIHAFIVF